MEPLPARAYIRFYAELNDHLPRDRRFQSLEKSFFVPGSVKDAIESLGVPHAEVELVVVNGESVPFSYSLKDGDRVAVYPIFESFDITPELRVRPEPLREPKFVLDVHLGRLAAYLRMLGFDAAYANHADDADLVRAAAQQQRTLLTRDRGLLRHGEVTHGYWVRHSGSRLQLGEVVTRFDLARALRPFTRCMACNGVLADVPKADALPRVPQRAAALYDEFRECRQCGRVYWKGSHYLRMQAWIAELTARTLGTSDS